MEETLAREREENLKRQEERDGRHLEIRKQLQENIATDKDQKEFVLELVRTVSSVVTGIVNLFVCAHPVLLK